MRRTAFVAALAAGPFAAAARRPAAAADAVAFRLGAMPIDPSAQAFYALDEGFFKSAGLDVAVTVLNNGSSIAAAAVSGSLDVGFGSPSPVILARERGIAVRFLAPAAVYTGPIPNSRLVVAKGSPIRTGADLGGKTIGVAGLHDLTQYSAQAWIDKTGGNAKAAQFVEVPYAEIGVALQLGRIAAGCVIEPFATAAKNQTETIANLNDAVASSYLLAGWFALETWLQKNGDVARRFVTAMRQSARWANGHQRESAAILMRYTKIEPAVAATMLRAHYDEGARVEPRLLQPVIDLLVKYGGLAPLSATDLIWNP